VLRSMVAHAAKGDGPVQRFLFEAIQAIEREKRDAYPPRLDRGGSAGGAGCACPVRRFWRKVGSSNLGDTAVGAILRHSKSHAKRTAE
jgi:hypothetical protein